jgi:hypothetical protein
MSVVRRYGNGRYRRNLAVGACSGEGQLSTRCRRSVQNKDLRKGDGSLI